MRRLVLLDDSPDEPFAEAARILASGGLVAFPTETVYGLGAVATDPAAVKRVFAAKGRPPDDPLIVHVREHWPLDEIVSEVPPMARRLMEALWPGPLTIVLEKADAIPDLVTSGLPRVAVRAPSGRIAQRLLDHVGLPIAAPSANRFSYVSATSADHVAADLGESVDLILDGGPTHAGIESTVVAVDGDTVTVLRHGALTTDQIRRAVPDAAIVTAERDADAATSPGRMLKHYSPSTPTVACAPGADLGDLDGTVCLLAYADSTPRRQDGLTTMSLGSRADLDDVARHLYAHLRSADLAGHDNIAIELTGAGGLGVALDDRIMRAASGRLLTRAHNHGC